MTEQPDEQITITLDDLLDLVCELTKVPRAKMTAKNRCQPVAYARQLFMYLGVELTGNLTAVAACVNKERTTAYHAHEKATARLATPEWRKYKLICDKVKALPFHIESDGYTLADENYNALEQRVDTGIDAFSARMIAVYGERGRPTAPKKR